MSIILPNHTTMKNLLEEAINDYLSKPREKHRTRIAKLSNKVLDPDDLRKGLRDELGFDADMDKIVTFCGYNPKNEVYSLIYNYDKRGWLYIEMATRDLFFIEASKYPYPQKLLERNETVKKLTGIATLLLVLALLCLFVFLISLAF